MLDDDTVSNETKEFIKQKITSAKWLVKNVLQRNSTPKISLKALPNCKKISSLIPQANSFPHHESRRR